MGILYHWLKWEYQIYWQGTPNTLVDWLLYIYILWEYNCCIYIYLFFLFGGLEHLLFFIIYEIILPIDFHIFQDG